MLGGDRTWTGCVPSKVLIRAAAIAHTTRSGASFGVISSNPVIEFDRVIANVHRIREQIYGEADSPDVIQSMVDRHTL